MSQNAASSMHLLSPTTPSLAIGDAAASELAPVNVKILAGTEGSLTRSGEHHGGV